MACTEKQKEYARIWYHANKDRLRSKRREYALKNSKSVVERVRKWASKNREKKNAYSRENWKKWHKPQTRKAWAERNIDRTRALERERYRDNDKYRTMGAIKTASRRRSVCSWADKQKVAAIYAEARKLTMETGVPHVVDHVIPIKHELVSGLTNEFNLRVISHSQNSEKKNKFEVLSI